MHFVPVNGRSRNEIIPSGSEVNAPQLKTTSAIKEISCSAKVQTIHPFKFNPNLNNINDWKKLGLTEKQAQCIMKYVAKGGTFKSKSDLKKMRVIRSELLEKWWDYIQLPDEGQKPISEQKTNPVNGNDAIRMQGLDSKYTKIINFYLFKLFLKKCLL